MSLIDQMYLNMARKISDFSENVKGLDEELNIVDSPLKSSRTKLKYSKTISQEQLDKINPNLENTTLVENTFISYNFFQKNFP